MTTRNEPSPKAKTVGAILLIATLFGLLLSAQLYFALRARGEAVAWSAIVATQLPPWYIWALFVPIVARAERTFRIQGRWLRAALGHLAVAVGLMFARAAIETAAAFALDLGSPGSPTSVAGIPWEQVFWGLFRMRMGMDLLAYSTILGVTSALRFNAQWRERERAAAQLAVELSEARLRALRGQLNPHFFFNTMNSVAMLVRRERNADAVELIAGLSGLLRFVLDDSHAAEISLQEELHFIQQYLDIEKIRFGDRLRVEIEVTHDAQRALVPTLILQPIVENAIQHGVARRTQGGQLTIAADVCADRLWIRVCDNGPETGTHRVRSSPGIGLRNTRERLTHHYGDAHTFDLRSDPGEGTVVTLGLPFTPTGEDRRAQV